ncbi:MAG: sugar transferase [Actinomycetota bacterium]|nr:sugar transferase [Actinomycetota bacterium]
MYGSAHPAESPRSPAGSALALKHLLDLLLAGSALVLTLPIQAAAALAILAEDGRPVLYRQCRSGMDGKAFQLLKFRSMRVHEVSVLAMGQVGPEHPLVTRTGRLLRRWKIDELPQLLNVMTGSMSLVGPRPALPEQVAGYDEFQRRRLRMRPGLTGWGQVNGGPTLSWEERIVLDVWYVDHWSLGLDLLVLAKTLAVILHGEHPRTEALRRALEHESRVRANGSEGGHSR